MRLFVGLLLLCGVPAFGIETSVDSVCHEIRTTFDQLPYQHQPHDKPLVIGAGEGGRLAHDTWPMYCVSLVSLLDIGIRMDT